MESTRGGRGRGCGTSNEGGNREPMPGPNPEPGMDPNIQEKKEDEFIRLRQGTQTIAEYEIQFTRLSKFSPELIVTEQQRIRRFVQGLNVEIQKDLAVAQLNAFSDAVEKAQRKRGFLGSSSEQGDRGTPPKIGRGNGGVQLPGMSRGASQRGSVSASRGPCRYCGKSNHTEDVC
ncbi:uncharacterized protein LOC113750566 [Coffea eugenioides]|uniref:uncharacterized protein LOC113750566 n=1 Tax=Coffea eugenioides TaxID=49369 RepID=UPI000F6159CD|nr:uncharacterized protein LOC113750566 [Coffea eugenioides]